MANDNKSINLGHGVGRRKTSVARVYLRDGNGKVTINGKDVAAYFVDAINAAKVVQPFAVTETEGKYDVVITVAGGGICGVVNGLLSLSGPISSAVFLTLGLSPAAYIASEAAASTAMHIIQISAYGGFGLISGHTVWEGLVTGAAMVSGNWIALRKIKNLKRKIYRRTVAIVMIVCSIWLFLSIST